MGNCFTVNKEVEERFTHIMNEAISDMKKQISECIRLELSHISKSFPMMESVLKDDELM